MASDYTAAWEAADIDAIVALLAADARYAMPPLPEWYAGRSEIRDFLIAGPARFRWRFLATVANGQPAFGTYWRDERRDAFVAMALDVVAVHDGAIIDLTAAVEGAAASPASGT
ncbi:nuclear transport factor 2 family protein [Nocardia sp. CC216A]|uniref:nuclear transport factor 2 family protein n=1 Tax=Nocardia sp. CC216A TaxID=3044158 RepID=UPI0024A97118|nr:MULTISPECIES: nuclear transport factor 2 family protein [unclassified Nocardia]